MKRCPYMLQLTVGLVFVAGFARASLAEDFYKGKTITFIVGFSPGGGYDTYTRATARHISKHIPGNPAVVVQNMPGAGGLIATHYLYRKAKPDGLTIGNWNNAKVLLQALGDRAIRFKSEKFGWIGAPVKGFPACTIMGFTGLKTIDDVLHSKKPLKMGATRAGSTVADMPKMLNKTIGTNFEVVTGYKGTSRIRLAMQRRELDGACWGWESIRVTARSMLDAKGPNRLIPYIIQGNPGDPEVKDLPQIASLIKDKKKLAMFKSWATVYKWQRPLSVPPGTPKERLAILRKAYIATMKDPAFLAEAKKSKLLIIPVSGEEIDKLIPEMLSISPELKEDLQFLVGRKTKRP